MNITVSYKVMRGHPDEAVVLKAIRERLTLMPLYTEHGHSICEIDVTHVNSVLLSVEAGERVVEQMVQEGALRRGPDKKTE